MPSFDDIYIYIKDQDKNKLIEEIQMKNWSICNISEGMESEVKLLPDDIIDSFLNENGIYAGSPLLEFIDIKKLRRSLLKEMDADVPQNVINPPAMVKTAEVKFLGIDQNTELDKQGKASFTFQIEVPAFATQEQKNTVISKVRTEISNAQHMAMTRVCQLYYTTPDKAYTNVMKQFAFGISNENNQYVSVPNIKGKFDLSGIESGKLLTCKLIFTPTLPAFENRFLEIRARNFGVGQAHRNIDAAEAAAAEDAKPKAPEQQKPKSGPSFSPTGQPTYDPNGN